METQGILATNVIESHGILGRNTCGNPVSTNSSLKCVLTFPSWYCRDESLRNIEYSVHENIFGFATIVIFSRFIRPVQLQ